MFSIKVKEMENSTEWDWVQLIKFDLAKNISKGYLS